METEHRCTGLRCLLFFEEGRKMSEEVAGAAPPTPAPLHKKKKILSADDYKIICNFIHNYRGLAIDCEMELRQRFADVHRLTLKSIQQTEFGNQLRSNHWRYDNKGKKYLQIFEAQAAQNADPTLLLKMASTEAMSPVLLCRTILHEKYHNKVQLSRLMKYPQLIEDPKLSANVIQCLCSDNQDGPLVDLRRRIVGEEYEFKLKQLAKTAGMHYYDENDLRRMGYDKTPDIKMILPILYREEIVNWVESKAMFGDPKTHKRHIQLQLNSYYNRFGPGIVIYWFGYHEQTPQLAENNVGITVLADFPEKKHLHFLQLDEVPAIELQQQPT